MYKHDTSSSSDLDPVDLDAPIAVTSLAGGGASMVAPLRGAPRLLGSTPSDGAGGVNPTDASVTLYFNEPVLAGSGYIYVTDGAAQTVIDRATGKPTMRIVGATDTRVIPVGDASQVSIVNGTVQIHAGKLLEATTYNVVMAKGVFTDLDGNPFGGISASSLLNFTTTDPPPTATINMDRDLVGTGETATVTVTFSEAVQDLSNGSFLVSSGALGTFTPNAARTVWTATFTPALAQQDDINLITLPGSAFRDLAGNYGTGSYNSANYIVDTLAPTMTSAATRTGVAAGTSISITFNEAMYWEDGSTMSLTVAGVTSTIERAAVTFSLDHRTMTIPASALNLEANKVYTLALPVSLGDQAGNAPTTTTVTIDTNTSSVPTPNAPDLTLASDTGGYYDSITTDTTPSFWISGTVVGGTIRLYDNGVLVNEMAASSTGFTEITAPPRGFGTHVFTVKNTDGWGNESLASAGTTVEITDALIHVDPAAYYLQSGSTAQVTFTFAKAVSSLDASAFTVANGTLSGFSGSGTSWTATLTPTAGIDDDTNIIVLDGAALTFADGSHGTSASYASKNYEVDTIVKAWVSPAIAIVDNGRSASDYVTSEKNQTISGTYNGDLAAGESIQLILNTGLVTATVDPVARTWTWSGTVDTGSQSVVAYVTDGSYYSKFASRSFNVDQTAPVATGGPTFNGVETAADFYLGFDEALYWDDGSTLTFHGNGQTLNFTAAQLGFSNGNSWIEIPSSLHQMIANTAYTVTLPGGLADKVGNQPAATYNISTEPDPVAPEALAAYVTSAPGDYGIGDIITIVVRFSEAVRPDGDPSLVFNVGGGEGAALYVSGEGTTDLVFNYTVQDGDHATVLTLASTNLEGIVRDLAGNAVGASGVKFSVVTREGGGTLGISIDGVPPDALDAPNLDALSDLGISDTDNITSDNTPTFSGSGAAAGALVHLWMDDEVVAFGYADGSGNYSLTPMEPLADGNHEFAVLQFDSYYNPSTLSLGLDVVIDTTDPVVSTASSGAGTALTVTFDDAIRFTSGSIEVRNASDVVVRTILPTDTGLWSISGSTLTVQAAGLADGTYSVKFSADAVQDVTGNFNVTLVGSVPGLGWLVGASS
jgi:hypothetical protein